MLQQLIDDFVDVNIALQNFLSLPSNINQVIEVKIDDFNKSILLLCQDKRLLLLESNQSHSNPTVSIQGSLSSLYSLSKIEPVSPATIQSLDVHIVGDMSFLLRFADTLKSVSLNPFLELHLSRIIGATSASMCMKHFDNSKKTWGDIINAMQRQGKYIASETNFEKKLVTESDVQKIQDDLYQQHLDCQRLQQKIIHLKTKLD